MRRILTILALLVPTVTFAQKHRTVGDTTSIDTVKTNTRFDGAIILPKIKKFDPRWDSARATAYNPDDSMLYVFTGKNWIPAARISGAGSGTVTQVSAGLGMRFTAITSTGSVGVDTYYMVSWAHLYKVRDSLLAYYATNPYSYLTSYTETDPLSVHTGGSYANPLWITELAWSKITGAPVHFIADSLSRTFDSLLAHNARILALERAGGYTETDPVALAKTVTMTTGYGLTGGGAAQPLSSNPAWTFVVDTGTLYPALFSTFGAGYAITKSGRTYLFDSATAFTAFMSTLGTGYGVTKSGRTFTVDTGTLFSYYTGRLAAGTGIAINGRTFVNTAPDQTVVLTAGYGVTTSGTYPNFIITLDTATTFAKVVSTLGVGYGLNYTGRTFKLDTATVYAGSVSTLGVGYGLSLAGRTFKLDTTTSFPAVVGTIGAGQGVSISGRTVSVAGSFTVNNQTGTAYTLVLSDAGKWVTSNNGSAVTFTVPPNSSVAYAVDSYIQFSNYGAGKLTIAAGSGVTINGTDSNRSFVQYAEGYIHKIATDTWVIGGKTSN